MRTTVPQGKLPDKEPGRHRWVSIVSYTLTDQEAADATSRRAEVTLDASRMFSPVLVGCLDCEGTYSDVLSKPCPAGDEWGPAEAGERLSEYEARHGRVTDEDLQSITRMPLVDDLDEDTLIAAADVVQRSGATGFEVGYVRENVPMEEAGWYAHALYRGARIITEHHRSPIEAAEGLARSVLRGGQCQHCNKTVKLGGQGSKKKYCQWTREGPRWVRGCEER